MDQCKYAAGCAAPMPQALLQWCSKLRLHINEGCGTTENLTLHHITELGKSQQGTVGFAYKGVEQRIGAQTGGIQMRIPALMTGYFKEPEKTQQTFTNGGWLNSGDKGSINEQGLLRITSRVKDLPKTGQGKYLVLALIEDKLVMHGAVEACVVTGANLGQRLGTVMLNAEAAANIADACARSRTKAFLMARPESIDATPDPHEKLRCVVVVTTARTVENDVFTPTFKVKRKRIEDLNANHHEAWVASGKRVIWQAS